MTIKQQAYGLIDELPEDSVQAIIQIMIRMVPGKQQKEKCEEEKNVMSQKMEAFLELQEMRKKAKNYHFTLDDRAAAMDAKFGDFTATGGC